MFEHHFGTKGRGLSRDAPGSHEGAQAADDDEMLLLNWDARGSRARLHLMLINANLQRRQAARNGSLGNTKPLLFRSYGTYIPAFCCFSGLLHSTDPDSVWRFGVCLDDPFPER